MLASQNEAHKPNATCTLCCHSTRACSLSTGPCITDKHGARQCIVHYQQATRRNLDTWCITNVPIQPERLDLENFTSKSSFRRTMCKSSCLGHCCSMSSLHSTIVRQVRSNKWRGWAGPERRCGTEQWHRREVFYRMWGNCMCVHRMGGG